MRLENGSSDQLAPVSGGAFDHLIGRDDRASPENEPPIKSVDSKMLSPSGGGLGVPDGRANDPFPPSLAAYVEVMRAIAEYLREQGIISGPEKVPASEPATTFAEQADVDEPTTFAIGEEEHAACLPVGPTPAIGGAT